MMTTKPLHGTTSILTNTSSGIHPGRPYIRRFKDSLQPFHQPKLLAKLEDPKLAPFRAHPTDAGADLMSKEDVGIYPGEQKLIDTGVAIKIPVGHVGFVFNRSSQGKLGIQIANGTGIIDSDYRGNLKVLLKNTSDEPYFITAFTSRIAQLVIVPIVLPHFVPWTEGDEPWDDTERGTGGFGSTNKGNN